MTELGWRSHCLNVRPSSMPVTCDALAVPVEVMIHLEAACHAHLGGTAQHREVKEVKRPDDAMLGLYPSLRALVLERTTP